MPARTQWMQYSPVGDLATLCVCVVVLILLYFSYMSKAKSSRIFLGIIGLLIAACLTNVLGQWLMAKGTAQTAAIILRCLYHATLYSIMAGFLSYIGTVTKLEPASLRPYMVSATVTLVLLVALETVISLTRNGAPEVLKRDFEPGSIFLFGYAFFVLVILVELVQVRGRLYSRVMKSFYGAIGVSLVMVLIQALFGYDSYTTATYLFPVVAMLYILHSSPYDAELGANDVRVMEDLVKYSHEKTNHFLYMSLYMREFLEDGKHLPEQMHETIRRFTTKYFRRAVLIQVSNDHLILMMRKDRNPNYDERYARMLADFKEVYRVFQYDYKIVIGESEAGISEKNEYISLIRSIHKDMEENSIHWVQPADITKFRRNEQLIRELIDMDTHQDLDDPRVLVYTQPVFNLRTGKYDTAEALMRMQVPEMGLVYPDEFIPVAEENGYIHLLTRIILNKTCRSLRNLKDEGYEIRRISVNVSALELRDDGFCGDIGQIVAANGLSGEEIAIELTESQSENDFLLMKGKIEELKKRGITFYLDDFGTGYSNMERIMALPFDIIKFDRSMVVAGGHSKRSEKIVGDLANMFVGMDYSVLYEGVESEADEKMCMDMQASYLQGYKYSKPVPIGELKQFLERRKKGEENGRPA